MCTIETNKNLDRKTKNLIKGNAIKYMRYKDRFDQISEDDIVAYRKEVAEAFGRIKAIDVDENDLNFSRPKITDRLLIMWVVGQPYNNLEEMSEEIRDRNLLRISKDFNDSLLLPGELNLKFRAVHDYLHYILQQPFGFEGEYKVYQAQKHIHKSKLRRQILYSEIVLQAAYCEYFGKFADNQKIVL